MSGNASQSGLWTGSRDGEWFDGPTSDTPEGAVEEWDNEDRPCRFVGQIKAPDYTTGHAYYVLENMECRAGDNAHPDCDVSLAGITKDKSAELDAEISAAVKAWMARHGVGFTHYEIGIILEVVDGKPVPRSKP